MNPGEKFQRDMQKLGLGVSLQMGGDPAVTVTTWCPVCNHVAAGSPETCPECGAAIPGVDA